MIEIWFEPHATTLDNEAKIASGWNDIDLSPLGLSQAQELVSRVKERGTEVIFCSDMQRAVKTAIPSSNIHHIPIYPDERLRECDYGDFTQESSDVVAAEKSKRITLPFPNGESYEHTVKRVSDFLDFLKERFDGRKVMIIGHRATQYALDNLILGRSLQECTTEEWQWQPGWKYELK